MSIAPPIYVDATTPESPRFGLFSVAQMVGTEGERWETGVEWEPLSCLPAGLASYNCDNDAEVGYPLTIQSGVGLVEVSPFLVYGSYGCSSASRSFGEAEARARAHLALGEERAVERALAAGGFGAGLTFQGATDLTPGGGAVSLVDAVGLLEAAIGEEYGGIGVIHTPRALGSAMSYLSVATREGQRLETLLGNYVAAGAGYDLAHVGPTGVAPDPGTGWLYATGRPKIRRSEVIVTPDEEHFLQRGTNDVEIIAQRAYAIGWDCITLAVNVNPSLSSIGGVF